MSLKRFEIVEHTADWAIRVFGRDLEELLIHAAQGMNSLLVTDVGAVGSNHVHQFELDAYDAESLLVDWLSELAYWVEMSGIVFHQFQLSNVSPVHLDAVVRGGHVSSLQKHIKAVTYHDLEIKETGAGLEATVVFDV